MSRISSVSTAIVRHLRFPPLSDLASGKGFASRPQKALFIFAVWTVIGVLQYLALLQFVPQMALPASLLHLVDKMVDAWTWALLTPALLFVDRKLPHFDSKPWWHAGTFLLFSVPFSFIHTYLAAVFLYPIPEITWTAIRLPTNLIYWFFSGLQNCCIAIGVFEAFRYYKHYLAERVDRERAEKRLLESHLNTLRMQLEPHFLFNALNAISSEMIVSHDSARRMIEDLGALLRLSLDYHDSQEIPLSRELVLLEHYLRIQHVRFGDRIKTSMHISPEVLNIAVPTLLLQPIVENAFRHGLGKSVSGGTVTISASLAGDCLELRVEDDGVGLHNGWRPKDSKGLGLRVTRDRLEGLYPGIERSFEIQRGSPDGTEVIMRVPARVAEVGQNGTRTN